MAKKKSKSTNHKRSSSDKLKRTAFAVGSLALGAAAGAVSHVLAVRAGAKSSTVNGINTALGLGGMIAGKGNARWFAAGTAATAGGMLITDLAVKHTEPKPESPSAPGQPVARNAEADQRAIDQAREEARRLTEEQHRPQVVRVVRPYERQAA